MSFELNHIPMERVRAVIKGCQSLNHVQQVSFSTYHDALTQICYTCESIRTSMKEEDLDDTHNTNGSFE